MSINEKDEQKTRSNINYSHSIRESALVHEKHCIDAYIAGKSVPKKYSIYYFTTFGGAEEISDVSKSYSNKYQ